VPSTSASAVEAEALKPFRVIAALMDRAELGAQLIDDLLPLVLR
jgi:hypothetical protein